MPELSRGRRLLVLAICCMSLLIVSLDNTIVNVALPEIQRDLDAPIAGLQWTIDAYTLVLAGLLMLCGSIGDRFGRRRTFQTGLILFSIGSLLCSLAPNLGWLVAFRMLQAVGGSMMNPVAMSIIANVFVDPRERARAIGVWGGVVGISLALGPVVGGVLVTSVGWRSIFWINVPVGVAAVLLTALFVPESRAPRPRRADPVGQVLVIVLLASLTYGIIEGPGAGWFSARILACFCAAAVALVALVRFESRRAEPLLDPRFFRSVPFSGATMIAVSGFSAFGGFLLLSTLYLQTVRGYSPLHAGLFLLPVAVTALVCSPLSGRMVASGRTRVPLVLGGIAIIISAVMMTGFTTQTPADRLIAAYLVFGLGTALINAPITNSAVAGMPRTQAGVAAAIASTSRQVGVALGVAVAGSVLASGIHDSLRADFVEASRLGWWIIAGYGVAVLALGFITTGRWARRTAERAAAALALDEPPVVVDAR
ncbi:MAG: MFS transporter [Actinomadura sp.]